MLTAYLQRRSSARDKARNSIQCDATTAAASLKAHDVEAGCLIVEDEQLLRMDAANFIAEAGFEVVETAHAEETLTILTNRHDIAVVSRPVKPSAGECSLSEEALSVRRRDGGLSNGGLTSRQSASRGTKPTPTISPAESE